MQTTVSVGFRRTPFAFGGCRMLAVRSGILVRGRSGVFYGKRFESCNYLFYNMLFCVFEYFDN